MWHKWHIVSQLLLKIEFYKGLTVEKFFNCVTFCVTCSNLCHIPVRSIIHLRWANDCAISLNYCTIFHENCAISHSLFLVQKLISRKFHFQKKWFIISLCSLLFVLCLSKSRDLTNTKYGSREITWNNDTKSALHHQSFSLSLSLVLASSVSASPVSKSPVGLCAPSNPF